MPRAAVSAGVLLYRRTSEGIELLLVHPGGPYWRNRDAGVWQIPKGQIEPGENAEAAARREAQEELGIALSGALLPLGTIRQTGGKIVHGFALEQDVDPEALVSNVFALEWPPGSGTLAEFPEVDEARWIPLEAAGEAMLPSQRPLLARLAGALARGA